MDTPETLAADMLKAAGEAVVGTRAIVQKGSLNIKNEAKRNVEQSAPIHNAHAANAITYDTEIDARGLMTRGEIGYDKNKQVGSGYPGRLGNILEYGSRHNPAHRDLGRALDSETPRFEEALAAFIGKLL